MRAEESLMALGTLVDDRYALERSLGKGGMGEVFLARERTAERIVALKLLRRRALSTPAARERFYREARTLGSLIHDNIVRLYAVGEHKGMPYIVTELITGMAVDRLLSRAGRLEWTMATHIANQTAAALSIAHAKGILHRDVKPANLIIGDLNDEQGHVWLLDFGIALPRSGHKMTQGDDVVGTPLFMSPEQVAGEPVDERTDIYALGVTLFWLLTGRPPFETHEKVGVELDQILDAHLDEEPRRLRDFCTDFPDDLEVIVGRCLAKEPADRFANVEALQAAFHGLFRASLPPDHPLAFAVMRSRFLQERKEALASGRPHELTAISRMWQSPESDAAPPAAAPPVAAPPVVVAPVVTPPVAALATTARAPVVIAPSPSRAFGQTANDARFYPVAETLRMPKRPRLGPEGTALMAPRSAEAAAGVPHEPPREARETLEMPAPTAAAETLPFRAPRPTAVVPQASMRTVESSPRVEAAWQAPEAEPVSSVSWGAQEKVEAQHQSKRQRSFRGGAIVLFALAMTALGAGVTLLGAGLLLRPHVEVLRPTPLRPPTIVPIAPAAPPEAAAAASSTTSPAASATPAPPAAPPAPAPRPRTPQPRTDPDQHNFEGDVLPPVAPAKPSKKPTPPDPF